MSRIVDYAVTKVKRPDQYAARFKIQGGGWTRLVRLKRADGSRIAPTITTGKHTDEADNVQADIRRSVLVLLQDMIKSDSMIATRCKYGTCGAAMQAYLKWYATNKRDYRVKSHGGKFIERFGDLSLARLDRQSVDLWIQDMLAAELSYDTIRLRVTTGQSMINWLIENREWVRANPFSGRMKHFKNRFPAKLPVKAIITDEEYDRILSFAAGDQFKAARVFIQIARMTGLRPSEVKRLNTKHLDHAALTWSLLVTKTKGRQFYRMIAIPARLSAFVVNEGITGALPMSGLISQFRRLKEASGVEVDLKMIRKDFSHRMEVAGAPHDAINLHQGRAQNGVLIENYLTDPGRAVNICRKYIDAMYGEAEIRRVK